MSYSNLRLPSRKREPRWQRAGAAASGYRDRRGVWHTPLVANRAYAIRPYDQRRLLSGAAVGVGLPCDRSRRLSLA